jgi:hypothetical protein
MNPYLKDNHNEYNRTCVLQKTGWINILIWSDVLNWNILRPNYYNKVFNLYIVFLKTSQMVFSILIEYEI